MPDRILIVDDEAFNLDVVEQELTDRGYATEQVPDGAEALRKSGALRPDVVLPDCMMPGMSSLDVLKSILDADQPVVVDTRSDPSA
jgi:CheY-like chemotaxis protein